uniref:C2H2-type domain-containing protein n=1 Tax=Trichogramma kaykai TaxID=54128 RepID=A0ABD2XP92_9HYME
MTASQFLFLANHMNEVTTSQEKLDEKIFIEIECKHVKLELESSSTNICRTEYQSCLPIVKIKNGNQTNDMNENVFNEFPVHNSSKPFDFDICHKSFGRKSNRSSRMMVVHNRSQPFECEICCKSFGHKQNLKRHMNLVCNSAAHLYGRVVVELGYFSPSAVPYTRSDDDHDDKDDENRNIYL